MTRLRREAACAPDAVIVTVETVRGARRLAAVGPAGEAAGLRAGQSLSDARAIHPGLVAADAAPADDLAALESLADWCARYTPLVAVDDCFGHGLWLDVAGCAHLFGGEAALLADLATRLARHGISSRLAIAGAGGAAWALARHVGERRIVPAGAEAMALRDLPVAALRLEPEVGAGLRKLGLRTIGELARVPRDAVTARFGMAPALRLDQALGRATEAIAWRHEESPWSERLDFVEPIGAADDLNQALAMLTKVLCRRLEERDLGCHRLVAGFFRVDGTVRRITVTTGLPSRDAGHHGKLLREKMDSLDPGFGVDAIVLHAEATARLAASQAGLADMASAGAGARVAAITDVIGNRIGPERVWRVGAKESHVPERAVTRLPALSPPPVWAADPSVSRPIRLLRRPERLAVTSLLPDEPPATFRWRGAVHQVRAATGPERIAAEWWGRPASQGRSESDLIRDYYKVEDIHGARFWVFRAGLHGGGRAPVWYLHGLFA